MFGLELTVRLRVFKVPSFFLTHLVSCFALFQMICLEQRSEVLIVLEKKCKRNQKNKQTKCPVKIRAPSWWWFRRGHCSLTELRSQPQIHSYYFCSMFIRLQKGCHFVGYFLFLLLEQHLCRCDTSKAIHVWFGIKSETPLVRL